MIKKFLEYIKSRRFWSTVIIFIVAALVIFLSPLYCKYSCPEGCDIAKVELIDSVAQIVSALFVILGTVIAVWQYYISSTHKINQTNKECIQHAVELARYYKDNIIDIFSIIKVAAKEAGIHDIMISHIDEMNHFDVWEKDAIFSNDELDLIKEGKESPAFFDKVIQLNARKNLNLVSDALDVEKLSDSEKKDICNYFWDYLGTKLLNEAEYFAMHFSHKVADDTVIYQSIYPTYLEMCCLLYLDIVKCRDPQKAKLYCNVVYLFVSWKNTSSKQKQKAIEMFREASNELGSIVEKNF